MTKSEPLTNTDDNPALSSLVIRRNARARRVSLRLDTRHHHFVLTLPGSVPESQGLAFAASKSAWMEKALLSLPVRRSFQPGETLPLRGVEHRIEHDAQAPARVTLIRREDSNPVLFVGGTLTGLDIRVLNWLKRQARQTMTERSEHMAQQLSVTFKQINIGDAKTRWGSCSSRRILNYSWRLIMTPPEIIDYVAAHEVAHLKEMNHSPAFWKLVEYLIPDYKPARKWLRTHAVDLARYGPQ